MDKKLEDELFERFKQFFPNGRDVDPTKSLMQWGFSHGNGWYDLLRDMFVKLEAVVGTKYEIEVIQVKQKFGALRVYITPPHEDVSQQVYNIIWQAEMKSSSTCEKCGKKGTLKKVNRILVLTLCDEHGGEKKDG